MFQSMSSLKHLTPLFLFILVACSSRAKSIQITAEITPEPVVGQIATLHIETIAERHSGEGVISIIPFNNINIVDGDLEWRGSVTAGEPVVYELSFCITQPGQTGFYMSAVVKGGVGENQLQIYSTGDSATVVPSSENEVHQAPLWSTLTPTPEPVIVSAECAGDEQ